MNDSRLRRIRGFPWLVSLIATMLPFADLAATVIVENFDVYPGSSSDVGWANAWNSGSTPVTTTLLNTNPVNGGGQYLNVTSTGSGNAVVRRRIDPVVLNTATTVHTISWDVRYDSLSGFTAYDDRLHFMANRTGALGSDATASWLIGAVGGNTGSGGSGNYFVGNWYFYNNRSDSSTGAFNGLDMVDTGISVTVGHTYHFSVQVDPVSQTYQATIVDQTAGVTFSQAGLNFRDQEVGMDHQYLVFGGTKSSSADANSFSFDRLTITPEPGRSMMLGLALAWMLIGRRRK